MFVHGSKNNSVLSIRHFWHIQTLMSYMHSHYGNNIVYLFIFHNLREWGHVKVEQKMSQNGVLGKSVCPFRSDVYCARKFYGWLPKFVREARFAINTTNYKCSVQSVYPKCNRTSLQNAIGRCFLAKHVLAQNGLHFQLSSFLSTLIPLDTTLDTVSTLRKGTMYILLNNRV